MCIVIKRPAKNTVTAIGKNADIAENITTTDIPENFSL